MPTFSIPLSGLTASSVALSAIANNLANLNTIGYKDTRVLFRDLFYQSIGTSGGGDPIQLGAGTAVSAMPALFTQGSVDPSGVSTDVAIMQDGFFVVQKDGVTSYTRAGNFTQDPKGFLVTAEGEQVLGYPAVNGVVNTGQGLMGLNLGTGAVSPPTATTNLQIRSNLDATARVGDSFPATVTVYDSLGASHVLTFNFTKTASNAWSYTITIPAADVGATGNPVVITNGTGNLAFDNNGNLTTPAGNVAGLSVASLADGAANINFTWNLYNGGSGLLTQVAAASSTSSTIQDGRNSGSLQKFAIGSDGLVSGTFSNGKTAILGQLVLATFANQNGLSRVGRNDFQETLSSGQAVIGAPGTGGRGTLSGGALELSNVDIAKEFAAMIVAQRGFQANARAVTTFDEITQETINLKR
ncbi:MAG TPA: flagellar hook protein FlgE [Terriglobales bacterium]|jgi:flagellar hook protein FlgE